MIDIAHHLQAIRREVQRREDDGGTETVAVVLRRSYRADAADVWSAITEPDRIRRWFTPLTGDLRVGGSFQLENHSTGDILACEPPKLLRVTLGGPESVVEVRLAPEGADRTTLELDHRVPISLAGSGAGALWVGPGWDGALLGIALYLRGEMTDDPAAMANSPEAQRFSYGSVLAWVAEVERSGTATAEQLEEGRAVSLQQFAPDLVEPRAES